MQGNLFKPGLPALHTLLTHADFWFGVDLFLAISGFVIARSLIPQMHACAKDVRARWRVIVAFWIRRVWRLLPSAWIWLGIMLLAAVWFNRSHAFGPVHANIMATLAGVFDVANFRFADALFRYPYGTSFVYWSLSLEEQFYLLLPLAVLVLRRRIYLLMIALVAIQLMLTRGILLMAIRTDAIALGVLLAIAYDGRAYARFEPRWLLRLKVFRVLIPCLLLAGLAIMASADMQTWRFSISAIALMSAVLVWLASYGRSYVVPDGWFKRALVWVGARSYAIYLIHIPAYFALRESGFRLGVGGDASLSIPPWLLGVLALACILLLADLNYRYLERPLRQHGRNVARRWLQRRSTRQEVVSPDSMTP